MKTRLLSLVFVLICLSSSASNRREKRKILNKVNSFIEQTVAEAEFITSKGQLVLVLDYYFLSRGYSCVALSNTKIIYSKQVKQSNGISTAGNHSGESLYKVSRSSEPFGSSINFGNSGSPHLTHYDPVYVKIELFKLGDTYRVLTEKIRSEHVRNPFNELNLLKFLYAQYFGINLALPHELSQEIETYNLAQTKQRKKIVFN